MKIWVDADACPKVIRETIVRAAERTGVECTFVANHLVPVPKRNNIHSIQVPSGFDIADDELHPSGLMYSHWVEEIYPLAYQVLSNKNGVCRQTYLQVHGYGYERISMFLND